jgi:hypothetical protein
VCCGRYARRDDRGIWKGDSPAARRFPPRAGAGSRRSTARAGGVVSRMGFSAGICETRGAGRRKPGSLSRNFEISPDVVWGSLFHRPLPRENQPGFTRKWAAGASVS